MRRRDLHPDPCLPLGNDRESEPDDVDALLEEIARTVDSNEEVEAEVRYLLAALDTE